MDRSNHSDIVINVLITYASVMSILQTLECFLLLPKSVKFVIHLVILCLSYRREYNTQHGKKDKIK